MRVMVLVKADENREAGAMGHTPDKIAAPWGTWDRMIEQLEVRLGESTFIAGESFSAADIMIACSCNFMTRFDFVT